MTPCQLQRCSLTSREQEGVSSLAPVGVWVFGCFGSRVQIRGSGAANPPTTRVVYSGPSPHPESNALAESSLEPSTTGGVRLEGLGLRVFAVDFDWPTCGFGLSDSGVCSL